MPNRGKLVIVGIVGLAVAAAALSTWYHYRHSHRALDFWSPQAALTIAEAPEVLVMQLARVDQPQAADRAIEFQGGWWRIVAEHDAKGARGMANLRRALVLDTTFDWQTQNDGQPQWQFAATYGAGSEATTVLFDFNSRQVARPERTRTALLDPAANSDFRQFFDEQFPEGASAAGATHGRGEPAAD